MAYEGWQDTATARVPLVLPAAYGYVLLSAFVSVCAISFLSESVAQARKRFKVDYPELYASQHVVCAHAARAPPRGSRAGRRNAEADAAPALAGGGALLEAGGDCCR